MNNEIQFWSQHANSIVPLLTDGDDVDLWKTSLDLIFKEASFLAQHATESTQITGLIGCCSHWLRPHQTRWTENGGFAWPSGYGGRRYSRTGLPVHDWSTELYWTDKHNTWIPESLQSAPSKHYVVRVTVPARTTRHNQAAIPVSWPNGTPLLPHEPLHQIYGFRKLKGRWQCTATNNTGARHYEVAAESSKT